ncbi:MAG: aryl-sulfate sulfotransferase [Candidatus Thorarchaeota archaeon]
MSKISCLDESLLYNDDEMEPPPPPTPFILNDVGFDIFSTEEAFQGYTLFSIGRQSLNTYEYDSAVAILDMNGDVISEIYLGSINPSNLPAEFISPNIVLVGSENGTALWNITDNTLTKLGIHSHHEFEYNPNSNTVFILEQYIVNIEGQDYIYDLIKEYSMSGELVWTLDTRSFIPHTWFCSFGDYVADVKDLTHTNTIFYDAEEDVIYLNPRNIDTFYKINHTNEDVIWGLGEHGNFSMYNISGGPVSGLFAHGHAVEPIDDDTFILFDNDLHDSLDEFDEYSRIVEITINETTMTANHSWVYTAPSDYYSRIWGDADRLPNGDRLGTFGTVTHPSSQYGARLVQVNDAGQIVWELDYLSNSSYRYGIYRSERFNFHPILNEPEDIVVVSGSDTIISWDVWYNYRPKQDIEGLYAFYVQGELVEQGNVTFDRFWRSTELNFNLTGYDDDIVNTTLCVFDENGNQASDTVFVWQNSTIIYREAPATFEVGQDNASVIWTVYSIEDLSYSVSANKTTYASGFLLGTQIELNLTMLPFGHNHINLTLTGDADYEIQDTFWIDINPNAAPQFLLYPSNTSIAWGVNLSLVWVVEDKSPNSWILFIDEIMVKTEIWDSQLLEIQWTFTELNPVSHNITLILIDNHGNVARRTTWIDILSSSHPEIIWEFDTNQIGWSENFTLHWEIYFGTTWILLRNNSEFSTGLVTNNSLSIAINWTSGNWLPGFYNLTLLVANDHDVTSTLSAGLTIYMDFGDPYADSIISSKSEFYADGDLALCEPDNHYAIMFMDYSMGYITFDMGTYEEILDGTGDDLTIWARGGEYGVWVADTLESGFEDLGFGQGNSSYDLSTVGLSKAQYVRIFLRSEESVLVDAIEALHYSERIYDEMPPTIVGPENFQIYNNVTHLIVVWHASDITPWEYYIEVSGVVVESGPWRGEDIMFNYNVTTTESVTMRLTLKDMFGNEASDTVVITIITLEEPAETTGVILGASIVLCCALIGGLGIVWKRRIA